MAVANPWFYGALASLGLIACSPQLVDVVSGVSCCDDPTQKGCGGTAGASTSGGTGGGATATGGTAAAAGMSTGGSATTTLIHRYTFQGDNIDVTDSVGNANGNLFGTMLDGSGAVTLADANPEQYVELPSFILNGLRNVTFEAWVTWSGGVAWQRIFDFGEDMSGIRGRRGNGRSYLFLTPDDGTGHPKVAFGIPDLTKASETTVLTGNSSFPENVLTHVAVVVDDTGNTISLFVNGGFQGSSAFDYSLAYIYNINSWLGRSLYSVDAGFDGTIHDFRIYAGALDPNQVVASYMAGP